MSHHHRTIDANGPVSRSQQARADARFAGLESLEQRQLFSTSILALGDSITYGVPNPTDGNYRSSLGTLLNNDGESFDFIGTKADGPGDNNHYATPGGKAAISYNGSNGLRKSLRDAFQDNEVLKAGEKPDVILLHIGTNSLGRAGDPSGAINELRSLLNEMASQWRAGKFASDVKIFLAKIIPGAHANDGVSVDQGDILETADYNSRIPGLINSLSDQGFASKINLVDFFAIDSSTLDSFSAAERAQIDNDGDQYVDWFNGLNEANPSGNATSTNGSIMIEGDNLHPTDLGYRVMAEVWYDALKAAGVFGGGGDSGGGQPAPLPVSPGSGFEVQATGDFDGDGVQDQFWRNQSSKQNRIQLLNADGSVKAQSDPGQVFGTWRVVGNGDFNKDGKTDLFWNDPNTGKTVVWFIDGTNATQELAPRQDVGWSVTDVSDQNGDGYADVTWSNGQDTETWFMQGSTRIGEGSPAQPPVSEPAPEQVVPAGNPGSGFEVQATGDFDGDGVQDQFWRNQSSKGNRIYLLNDDGSLKAQSDPGQVFGTWRVVGSGDFNKDGKTDLFWNDPNTGKTVLWLVNGTSAVEYITPRQDLGWSVTNVSDQNGDGYADVTWTNGGASDIWFMQGATRIA